MQTINRFNAVTLNAMPKGFNFVYQGGLHSVYCNKKTHYYCTGGKAIKYNKNGFEIFSIGKCNCENFS